MLNPPRSRTVTFYESPVRISLTDGAVGPEQASYQTLTLPVEFVTGDGNDVVKLPNGMFVTLQ